MALSTSITLTVSDYDMKMSRSLKFYKNDALKLIFTINYWGYFIIQATHSTINYSYFLHKTDEKHMKNQ